MSRKDLIVLGVLAFTGCAGGDGEELSGDLGQIEQEQSTAPIAYLSYESSSWLSNTEKARWLHDPWNDNIFRIPVEGEPGTYQAWISTSMANEGRKSFGAWLHDVELCGDVKQRVEFEISNGSYFTQRLGDTRYYGIAMYVHPQSDPIVKPTVFLQAWQNHDVSNGNARFPPFSLRLIPGSDYRWSVVTASGDPAPGVESVIYTSPTGLQKGVWYEFIVQFKPSVERSGALKVWLNGTYIVGQTHQRNFGYVPHAQDPIVKDHFEVRFGAYRGRLCTTPPVTLGDTILMFDQVKFGTSYASVDP